MLLRRFRAGDNDCGSGCNRLSTQNRSGPIAKNRNTYAKRQREFEKQQRAADKRTKRDQKKDDVPETPQMTTLTASDFYTLPDISRPLP